MDYAGGALIFLKTTFRRILIYIFNAFVLAIAACFICLVFQHVNYIDPYVCLI